MFYSQYGQDMFVNGFFGGKRNGLYVDIGAWDGIEGSNTAYFEKELAWRGLCVEPQKEIYSELRKNRNSLCENKVVWNYTGEIDFLVDETEGQMSGVYDFMRPNNRELFDKGEHSGNTGKLPCISANELLAVYGFTDFDLLSVDTEGSEFVVITNIDFDKFNVKVIVAEINDGFGTLKEYLEIYGYTMVAILGQDAIYIKGLNQYMPYFKFNYMKFNEG